MSNLRRRLAVQYRRSPLADVLLRCAVATSKEASIPVAEEGRSALAQLRPPFRPRPREASVTCLLRSLPSFLLLVPFRWRIRFLHAPPNLFLRSLRHEIGVLLADLEVVANSVSFPLSFLRVVVAPLPIRRRSTPIYRAAATPVRLLIVPFRRADRGVRRNEPCEVHRLTKFQSAVIQCLRVGTVGARAILVRPTRKDVHLPYTTVGNLSRFRRFRTAMETRRQLLPVDPIHFRISMDVHAVVTHGNRGLPFRRSRPPTTICSSLQLSVVIRRPYATVFRAGHHPIHANIRRFLMSERRYRSISAPRSPRSTASIVRDFRGERYVPPLFLVERVPIPSHVRRLSVNRRRFPFFLPPTFLRRQAHRKRPIFHSFPEGNIARCPPLRRHFPIPLASKRARCPIRPRVVCRRAKFLVAQFPWSPPRLLRMFHR